MEPSPALSSHSYDVVVVGAGPVGLTTACTLKVINRALRVCVIDKREKPTRDHSLKINWDAANKVRLLLEKVNWSLTQSHLIDSIGLGELKALLSSWNLQNIRTHTIEKDLSALAGKLAIPILRGKDFEITSSNFQELCSEGSQGYLADCFRNAQVVIGADSAHSVVRQVAFGSRFAHEEEIGYVLECKFQSIPGLHSHSFSSSVKEMFAAGAFNFETISKADSESKAVAYRQFISQEVFNCLRSERDGSLKGVYSNPWNLAELKLLSKKEEAIKAIYRHLKQYLQALPSRGGDYQEERITAIPLKIYRSEKVVTLYENKWILLVGDAESGLVLERGFNKGLKGAALCAQVVSYFFSIPFRNKRDPSHVCRL